MLLTPDEQSTLLKYLEELQDPNYKSFWIDYVTEKCNHPLQEFLESIDYQFGDIMIVEDYPPPFRMYYFTVSNLADSNTAVITLTNVFNTGRKIVMSGNALYQGLDNSEISKYSLTELEKFLE